MLIRHEGKLFIANFWGIEGFNIEVRGTYDITQEIESETTQFLDEIYEAQKGEDFTLKQLRDMAGGWGILAGQLIAWLKLRGFCQEIIPDPVAQEFEYIFLIERFAEMLRNRGVLSTPEIMYASLEELPEWREHYVRSSLEVYRFMVETQRQHLQPYDVPGYGKAKEDFTRWAYYVWQIDRRMN